MEFNTVVITESDEFICKGFKPRIDYVLIPSRDRLRIVTASTGEAKPFLHKLFYSNSSADYKNPLYHNSKRQPLDFDFNPKTKLYEKTFPSYLAVTEFKDTGNLVFNIHIKTLAYSLKSCKVFKSSKVKYSFYIDVKTNKPLLFKDGKLGYTDLTLNNFFSEMYKLLYSGDNTEISFFKDKFLEGFIKGFGRDYTKDMSVRDYLNELTQTKGPLGLKNLYRVRSNPKLYDLPWSEYHLCSLYVGSHLALARRRILHHLNKGDTKAATLQGFYNIEFPKSIKKLMIQRLEPFEKTKGSVIEIKQLIEDVGLDNARSLLVAVDFRSLYAINNCLDIGFTPRAILNAINREGVYYLTDISSMHYRCSRRENLVFNPNMREYHDYLIEVANRVFPRNYGVSASSIMDYSELYKEVDTSQDLPYLETNEYIFRSPKTVLELAEVGTAMHICVGYYQDRAFLKNLNILLVIDKASNSYVGCIEVRGDYITQAKLKYNKLLSDDVNMVATLNEYCSINNIQIKTRDIIRNETFPFVSEVESDESREKLKLDFKLASGVVETEVEEELFDLFA